MLQPKQALTMQLLARFYDDLVEKGRAQLLVPGHKVIHHACKVGDKKMAIERTVEAGRAAGLIV